MMRSKWIKSIVGVIWITGVTGTGCVSPFYGTARIAKGFHVNSGIAVGQFTGVMMNSAGWPYIGPRADVEVGYAFSNSFKTHLRAGGGWGWVSREREEGESTPNSQTFLLDGAIGIQIAHPHKYSTLTLRLEAGLGGVCSALMFGIGEDEWLTIGNRVYFYKLDREPFKFSFAPFLGVHPLRHLSIFATPGGFTFYEAYSPLFTLGVGYKLK